MKVWQKQKNEEFGKTLFSWRFRAANRFFTKIFTWLLGGFVSGILTSILFLIIGLPAYSAFSARIVFFTVFILGVINAFFRNIYSGIEYRITEKALLFINPIIGLELKNTSTDTIKTNQRVEFINWDIVKEIADQEGTLVLTIKDREEPVIVGVAPVVKFAPASPEEAKSFPKLFKSNEKLDKEVLKRIVQKARDAKKAILQ